MKPARFPISTIIFLATFLTVGSLMIYSVNKWPYAPIRSHNGAYRDKLGKSYSYEEYRQFVIWERSLAVSFIVGFGSTAVASSYENRKTKKRN